MFRVGVLVMGDNACLISFLIFQNISQKILVSMLDARGPDIRHNFELVSAMQLANKYTV